MFEFFHGIFIALLMVGLFIGTILSLVRYLTDGYWHRRFIHRGCGYNTPIVANICPGCGETVREWDAVVARATLPWGWEFKK